jgi:hypothetical protein
MENEQIYEAGEELFFVLGGWHNGSEEMGKAQEVGPPDAPILRDGWYFLDDDCGHHGPYETRQAAAAKAKEYRKQDGE